MDFMNIFFEGVLMFKCKTYTALSNIANYSSRNFC